MLERVENAKIKTLGLWLTPVLLFLGFYLREMRIPLSWTCHALSGAAALILVFGTEDFKYFLKKRKKGSWKWLIICFLAIIGVLFFSKHLITFFRDSFHIPASTLPNSSTTVLSTHDRLGQLYFLATAWFNIIGEELWVAALTLPLHHFFAKKMTRNKAFFLATFISMFFFGAMHLGVYHGDWLLCFLSIGAGRLPFNYAWKQTDSLRGGMIIHVLWDYIGFIVEILGTF